MCLLGPRTSSHSIFNVHMLSAPDLSSEKHLPPFSSFRCFCPRMLLHAEWFLLDSVLALQDVLCMQVLVSAIAQSFRSFLSASGFPRFDASGKTGPSCLISIGDGWQEPLGAKG